MKSELIVDVRPDEIAIALTEDDRLMEVSCESRDRNTFAVGNIYLGRVKKVMPALNAVFVDVGHEKDAFLHYLDLGAQFRTLEKFTAQVRREKNKKPAMAKVAMQQEVGKQGNVSEVCQVGQEILVQVTKEPINTKGPRLSAEISFAGRNIVLIPFGEKVMVSSKIRSEAERSRLKQLVQAIKPQHFGVIVRTLAEGKRVAELDAELKLLVSRWEETVDNLRKAQVATLVKEEIGRTIGIIRDVFSADFSAIYVNDKEMCDDVKKYVALIAPEAEKIVHLYNDSQPIFDHFQITRQTKTGLGRTVGFKNGGYLIMERTEALFSIDVNSGSKKLAEDQETNAFNCNMLAADEIYHQLRLRDIGGIIIIDFIDMDSPENRQLLYEHMRQLMKRDRAKHNVLQLSKFGLMQITRQRVRPVLEMDVEETCPVCHGSGKVEPSLLFTDTLLALFEQNEKVMREAEKLYLHPFVYAYLAQGFFLTSQKAKWQRRFGLKIFQDESLALLDYKLVSKDGKRLTVKTETVESREKKADEKAARYVAENTQQPVAGGNQPVQQPKQEKLQPAASQPKQPKQEQPAQENVKQPVQQPAEPVAVEQKTPAKTKKASKSKQEKPVVQEVQQPIEQQPEPATKEPVKSSKRQKKVKEAASEKKMPKVELQPEAVQVATPVPEKSEGKKASSKTKKAATAKPKKQPKQDVAAPVPAAGQPEKVAKKQSKKTSSEAGSAAPEPVSAEPEPAKKAPAKKKPTEKSGQTKRSKTKPSADAAASPQPSAPESD